MKTYQWHFLPSCARKRKGPLSLAGITKICNLTPQSKILYSHIKSFQNSIKRNNAKSSRIRQQLLKSASSAINNLNKISLNFFKSQQQTQNYKPRGRRFTLEDKIFALSVYKQSGKAYRFLSKIFSLPSRKVLTAILNKIPFRCGINDCIFNHLKQSIKNLPTYRDIAC